MKNIILPETDKLSLVRRKQERGTIAIIQGRSRVQS
jgi:hypothetical protein